MGSRFANPPIHSRIENSVIRNGYTLIIIWASPEIWQVNDAAP
jgi:hypothetical protein